MGINLKREYFVDRIFEVIFSKFRKKFFSERKQHLYLLIYITIIYLIFIIQKFIFKFFRNRVFKPGHQSPCSEKILFINLFRCNLCKENNPVVQRILGKIIKIGKSGILLRNQMYLSAKWLNQEVQICIIYQENVRLNYHYNFYSKQTI